MGSKKTLISAFKNEFRRKFRFSTRISQNWLFSHIYIITSKELHQTIKLISVFYPVFRAESDGIIRKKLEFVTSEMPFFHYFPFVSPSSYSLDQHADD